MSQKLFFPLLAAVCSLLFLLPQARSQKNTTVARKYLEVAPLHGARGGATVSALTIDRGEYPSTIHLKGNVEIRANGFILRADEADYDESTGEIDAHGNVKVKPYPPLAKN